jgi:hypothetical protein
MEAASISISRSADCWVDRARQYAVIIDGTDVGRLKAGESAEFDVAPGEREVFLKLDWVRSRSINVSLSPGQRIGISCRSPSIASLPLALTVNRRNYITLSVEQS